MRKHNILLIGFTATLAVSLAGCSSGAEPPVSGSPLIPISVGVLPVLPTAALELGLSEGIFEKHGFDVSLESGQGGAALVPAVYSGEIEMGVSNPVALMVALDKGLPIEIVGGFAKTKPKGEDDVVGIWAMPDSGIDSARDLAGRTIAVNTLNSQGDATAREAVRLDGGDPSKIKFVEIGFPEMQAALELGNVDAVWTPEPYQSTLRKAGAELVVYNHQAVAPGLTTMALFTSTGYAEENPEIVEDFRDAWSEVLINAQSNPDDLRETVAKTTKISPDLVDTVDLENFDVEIDRETTQIIADLLLKDEIVSKPVDVDAFISKG